MKIHGGVPPTDGELEEMRDLERYSDEDYSVVLSYGSYRKAYSENGELPALLRSIFSTHQVIFIGYSLRDTVLRDVMQSVGALRGKKFPHVILQSPESVVPGEYREAFEEFYGVKVGTYSNHSRLAASLHSLMLSRA